MALLKNKYGSQAAIVLLMSFMFLLIYDGAIRKWIFPDHERYIYLLKDTLLLTAFVLIIMSRNWVRTDIRLPNLFLIPLAVYGVYVLLQLLNPNLPSTSVGLWGIKSHLFYSLIVFVLIYSGVQLSVLFQSLQRILPWVVIPVCILGILQTLSPADSWLNEPVRGGQLFVAPMGGFVRANATFSYLTGFAWYLSAFALISVALMLRSKKIEYTTLISITFLIIALPTNGSRSVIVITTAYLVILAIALWVSGFLKTNQVIKGSVTAITLIIFSLLAVPDFWNALFHRFLTSHIVPGDSARYITAFTNAFVFFDLAGLFGFGVGSASQAAPYLVANLDPYSWLPSGIAELGFEEESGRLVLELGMVGWSLGLMLRIALVFLSVFILFTSRRRDGQLAAAIALPVTLYATYAGHGVFAPPIGTAFFWLGVSLVVLAWREEPENYYAMSDKNYR
jgi:hypothetical protein